MTAGGRPHSVTIYGTGLMGCSFALALKKQIPGVRIYGVDSPEILERARRVGALDADGPQSADLIVLATPVGSILELLDRLQPGPELILDLGSTKDVICRKAETLQLPFLGGHPMTGSVRSGPEAASPDLFEGTRFFLCPVSTTPAEAVPEMKRLVEAIGAQPTVIAPDKHDILVARLSHLPQILSTLLADHTSTAKEFAGPGWKSVTRLGASPFHIWRDILQTSGSLPPELRSFIERLRGVLDALEAGNMQEIEAIFERANRSVAGGMDE